MADIFALTRDELLALERMANKSADNVMTAIEQARTGRTLTRLLTGLGIPHVGSVAARAIAERFRTLPGLIEVADKPEHVREELAKIRGIGPTIADSAASYLADADTRKLLHRLLELGVHADEPERKSPKARWSARRSASPARCRSRARRSTPRSAPPAARCTTASARTPRTCRGRQRRQEQAHRGGEARHQGDRRSGAGADDRR